MHSALIIIQTHSMPCLYMIGLSAEGDDYSSGDNAGRLASADVRRLAVYWAF